MRIILVESTDPYSPGDWQIFRSHADAQLYVEPDNASDPLIHLYDEAGNWYLIHGGSLVIAEDLPKADLKRVDAMLALLVQKHVGEPAATICDKLDQLLAFQEAPRERRRPLAPGWAVVVALGIAAGALSLILL